MEVFCTFFKYGLLYTIFYLHKSSGLLARGTIREAAAGALRSGHLFSPLSADNMPV